MKRTCRYVPLSKHPLVLVLCQVRFSPVGQIATYSPVIQDDFRRLGYPIERSGTVKQLIVTPLGVKVEDLERLEYRNKDESWSIIVTRDSVVLQATTYERFEDFAGVLNQALDIVLSRTENDKLGVIHRVGLRYVNLVRQQGGEGFKPYLRPSFHGVSDAVFKPGAQRLHVECVGATQVGATEGTMVIRVVQNDQGAALPPDLLGGAPKHAATAKAGEVTTMIDMDHFLEGTFEPSAAWVHARTYELHDQLIETFHEHVITPHAVEAWQ